MDNEDVPTLVPTEIEESPGVDNGPADSNKQVPVTIITGFLGSGKTTLLLRLLNDKTHKKRIAVIMNEYGSSAGIDKSIASEQAGHAIQDWIELENGCLCCSVKDPGVKAIEDLMQRKGRFDYIILETTGMADPGPIASIFWLDKELQSDVYLDGIVTVVDAKNIHNYLKQSPADEGLIINEATRQIALADRIILNKSDLSSESKLNSLTETLKRINSMAPQKICQNAAIDVDFILDLHSFDDKDLNPFEDLVHLHGHEPLSTNDVCTIVITNKLDIDPSSFDEWLRSILWDKILPNPTGSENEFEILRVKGWVRNPLNRSRRFIVQAVRDLYECTWGEEWSDTEAENKIVFIGRGIQLVSFETSFLAFVAASNVNVKESLVI